jgi:methylenetetrahydrofolate reductase (NADPH)
MHMVSASGAADTFAHDHLSETASIHDGGGPGEVNSAATWDEFPNGRFGDFKSPAYGENNQWGGSTLSVSFHQYIDR